MKTWETVSTIPTRGPGFFLRSHENSRYACVDSMMSPTAKDTLQVIDKHTLEVVARGHREPGKTLAHMEFTRDGRYVIASLMEKDGALIVLDATDPRGGQAPAVQQARGQVQRLEQDQARGRHQPLMPPGRADVRPCAASPVFNPFSTKENTTWR